MTAQTSPGEQSESVILQSYRLASPSPPQEMPGNPQAMLDPEAHWNRLCELRQDRVRNLNNRHRVTTSNNDLFGVVEFNDNGKPIVHDSRKKKQMIQWQMDLKEKRQLAIEMNDSTMLSYFDTCIREYKAEIKIFDSEVQEHVDKHRRMRAERGSVFYSEMPIIASRLILDQHLGNGGNGEVWRVLDADTMQSIALKLSTPRAMLKEEYRYHSAVAHANIIPLVATHNSTIDFEYEHKLYSGFLMDAAQYDLQHQLDSWYHSFNDYEVVSIMQQLLSAISYLHNTVQIAHFDLKPANILVCASEVYKLTDFQLAKPAKAKVKVSREGTLLYLPPECLAETEQNPRGIYSEVDMWAIGVICYQLVYRIHPILHGGRRYTRETMQRTLTAYDGHLTFPDQQSSLHRNVPEWLKEFMAHCLVRQTNKRPLASEALSLFAFQKETLEQTMQMP